MKIKLEKGDIIDINGISYKIDDAGSTTENPVLSRTGDINISYVIQKDEDSVSIDKLGLSHRSWNGLVSRLGIKTIGELKNYNSDDLSKLRNLGPRSVEEIRNKVNRYYRKKVIR